MNRREFAISLATEVSKLNYVNGTCCGQTSNTCFDVVDPATMTCIGQAPDSGEETVNAAVQSASKAFDTWAATPPLERSRILLAAVAAFEARVDDIAILISLETGRPFKTETRPEVVNAVKIMRYFAGMPLEAKGESFLYAPNVIALTVREPLGVVGAIIPWNVPAMLFCLKVTPALATGNTVVVKPAEQSPLSTMLLAKILGDHLPAGVLNVVNGMGETGQYVAQHPLISKLTFTGSVSVGKHIYRIAAERLVPVTLELGGKSPLIIFPDVPIEKAVQHTITGMRFSRQGQSCTSTTRIFVHDSIRTSFLDRLQFAVAAMKMGDPLDTDTEIGTLINREQVQRVCRFVEDARNAGVVVQTIGNQPTDSYFSNGCFLPAVLLLDPPMESPVVQQEIFGPVATIHSWNSFEQVESAANGTEFGLSACILTNSISDALTLARRLKAGFIQINSGMVIQPGISFGGYKSSGLGREASLSSMLEAFTQVKTIIVDHNRE